MGILWLASYPKSGNTWTRAFLANLFSNAEQPVNINTLPNFAFSDYRIEFFEHVSGKKRDDITDEDIVRLRPAVQRYIAGFSRDTLFIKTHSAMAFQEGVPTILPEVTQGAIYIVRNPLDVCVSYAHHLGINYDQSAEAMAASTNVLATANDQAFQLLGSWSDHVLSWAEAAGLNKIVMRYEDMIRQPERTFGKLMKYLHLPKNEARLKRAVDNASFKVLATQERQQGFVEKSKKADRFFRKGGFGGWREELSDKTVADLIEAHRPVMEKFDYLTRDGNPRF